jgi:hypothetical protein
LDSARGVLDVTDLEVDLLGESRVLLGQDLTMAPASRRSCSLLITPRRRAVSIAWVMS